MDKYYPSIRKFIDDISQIYHRENLHGQFDVKTYRSYPTAKNECFYVFDLFLNKIIYFKGFNDFLGYKDKIDLPFIFSCYHPKDRTVVTDLIKEVVKELPKQNFHLHANILNIAYRFKKNNGDYCKILSQTIVSDIDPKGKVTKVLLRYTDISFMDSTPIVKWDVDEKYFCKKTIQQRLIEQSDLPLTRRESEIAFLIAKNYTNSEIADQLCISKSTVESHRKSVYKKTNSHSKDHLILFLKSKGAI
ncbi:helix-turn-helix transcriptional regulator [Namhaeicola litoreus]|uniref:Helix-turn-helix transcriptional regulator n=1 Tax=Namhaeicola litoreus TaxID=1052145 RepID=A0ABW3Y0Z2_9FLAO